MDDDAGVLEGGTGLRGRADQEYGPADEGVGAAVLPVTADSPVPAAPVPPVEASGMRRSLGAFRHADFRVFWCGALVSNTGSWLQNLTVPYVLYQLTGSAFWVGLATVAQFLPGLLLGPLGGVLADRHERRRVLLVTQSCMALAALLLWAAWTTELRNPVGILGLVAAGGCLAGLNMPSWQSFVNDLVPREDLVSAVTLNSLQFNAARSLGPGIAGVLLAVFGPAWAFLLNAASFLFVLLALARVRRTGPPVRRFPQEPVLRHFRAAVRYSVGQPGILAGLAVVVAVGVLGNPVFQFTVVFAGSVLHVGPVGLGLLNAAFGVGAVIAAPVVSGTRRLTRATTVRWALLVYGVAIIAFGVAPDYPIALVALVGVGGCFLAVVSTVNTAVQMIVADHMRGRVLGLRGMVFVGATPVGALLQGCVADLVGPRPTVAGAGIILLLVTLGLLRPFGRLDLGRLDDPHDSSSRASCRGAELQPSGPQENSAR